MDDSVLTFDKATWNLDGLNLSDQVPGLATPITTDPALGSIGRAFYVTAATDQLAVISRPDSHLIETINIHTKAVKQLHLEHWVKDDYLFVSGLTLYIINPATCELITYNLAAALRFTTKPWRIPGANNIGPLSSVCVRTGGGEAYLLYSDSGTLIRLTVPSFTQSPIASLVHLDTLRLLGHRLGTRARLHLDELGNSLLIVDTDNKRILEVEFGTHDLSILWSHDSDESISLRHPLAAVTYYPHKIDKHYLTNESVRLLATNQRHPRSVLVADYGQHAVLKRVDFADTPLLLSHRSKTVFTTLLGSGTITDNIEDEVGETAPDDLRKWAIGSPKDISIDKDGNLLVALHESRSLLLLQPATSVRSRLEYNASRLHGYEFS